jgi:hypothetical protein
MRSRLILALAAAGMLTSACASSGAAQAPTAQVVPSAAAVTGAPTPAPTPSPTETPTATAVPQTDGEGDEAVVGELGKPTPIREWTTYMVGGVPHQRDGLVGMTQTMNDPRVTGGVEFTLNLDLYPKVSSRFGKWTLTNSGGSWAGPCTGADWAKQDAFAWGCWLTGSGDYAGYTFYQSVIKEVGQAPVIHGVIYEGAPPKA